MLGPVFHVCYYFLHSVYYLSICLFFTSGHYYNLLSCAVVSCLWLHFLPADHWRTRMHSLPDCLCFYSQLSSVLILVLVCHLCLFPSTLPYYCLIQCFITYPCLLIDYPLDYVTAPSTFGFLFFEHCLDFDSEYCLCLGYYCLLALDLWTVSLLLCLKVNKSILSRTFFGLRFVPLQLPYRTIWPKDGTSKPIHGCTSPWTTGEWDRGFQVCSVGTCHTHLAQIFETLLKLQCAQPAPAAPPLPPARSFLSTWSSVFDLQPSSFPTEHSMVAYVITLLSGWAQEWGTTSWDANAPECWTFYFYIFFLTYAQFSKAMKGVFNHSASGKAATIQLLKICQGSSSVSEYTIDFHALAASAGWAEKNLTAPSITGFLTVCSTSSAHATCLSGWIYQLGNNRRHSPNGETGCMQDTGLCLQSGQASPQDPYPFPAFWSTATGAHADQSRKALPTRTLAKGVTTTFAFTVVDQATSWLPVH